MSTFKKTAEEASEDIADDLLDGLVDTRKTETYSGYGGYSSHGGYGYYTGHDSKRVETMTEYYLDKFDHTDFTEEKIARALQWEEPEVIARIIAILMNKRERTEKGE